MPVVAAGLPCVSQLGYNSEDAWREMKHMADNGFGARLKELREQAGMTQQELADAAGMHRFGVAKLEQGIREPSWATVQALCKALNVSCEAFQVAAEPREPAGIGRPRKTASPTATEPETTAGADEPDEVKSRHADKPSRSRRGTQPAEGKHKPTGKGKGMKA